MIRRLLCLIGVHAWKPRHFSHAGPFRTMSRAECWWCRKVSLWHLGERVG
jgi:hypothetical protein